MGFYSLHAIEIPKNLDIDRALRKLEKENGPNDELTKSASVHPATINRETLSEFAQRAGPLFQRGSRFLVRPDFAQEGLNQPAGDTIFPFIWGFRELRTAFRERTRELMPNATISQIEREKLDLVLTAEVEALTAEALAAELEERRWSVKELEDNSFQLLLPATHNIEALDEKRPGRLTRSGVEDFMEAIGMLHSPAMKRKISDKISARLSTITPLAVNEKALDDILLHDFAPTASIGLMAAGFGDGRVTWAIDEPGTARFWQFALSGSSMALAARSGAFALFKGYRQQVAEQRTIARVDNIVEHGSCLVMAQNVAEELDLADRESVTLPGVRFKGVKSSWDLVIRPVEPHD